MDSLSPAEIRRLSVLKSARDLGIWPAPVAQSFAERHGISMAVEPEEPGLPPDRTVYRCTLQRDQPNTSMVVRFQVTAAYPEPPTADEVLRWLAMSCAHLLHTSDHEQWESFHYLTVDGASERYPYRGLVRSRTSTIPFAEALRMEMHRFYAFLGRGTYDALLISVGAA